MTELLCEPEPDIEEAKIVNYFKTGIQREAFKLYRKNSVIRQNELLILDKPINYSDADHLLIPLDIIPSDDNIDDLIDELSYEQTLSILNNNERIIVKLTIENGVPQRQIAARLGISQQTVSKYKRRALKKLKEYILHDNS